MQGGLEGMAEVGDGGQVAVDAIDDQRRALAQEGHELAVVDHRGHLLELPGAPAVRDHAEEVRGDVGAVQDQTQVVGLQASPADQIVEILPLHEGAEAPGGTVEQQRVGVRMPAGEELPRGERRDDVGEPDALARGGRRRDVLLDDLRGATVQIGPGNVIRIETLQLEVGQPGPDGAHARQGILEARLRGHRVPLDGAGVAHGVPEHVPSLHRSMLHRFLPFHPSHPAPPPAVGRGPSGPGASSRRGVHDPRWRVCAAIRRGHFTKAVSRRARETA